MDLRSTQLKDTYGNLVTTGTTAGAPTSGGLQNGQGTLLTSVGIGTDSPTETLDVRGSIKIGKDGVSPYLTFDEVPDNSSGSEFYLTHDISGNILKFTDDNSNDLIAMDRDSGNVGIGNTSPNYKLDITGSSNSQLRLTGSDTNPTTIVFDYNNGGSVNRTRLTNDAGDFAFLVNNNSEAMRIDSDGNVGIGTDSPAASLHIKRTSGSAGLVLQSENDQNSTITFGETSDVSRGAIIYSNQFDSFNFQVNNLNTVMSISSGGNLSLTTGNLILDNGAGIDFSDTPNSSGTMTSELLDDYEEGTWTPTYTTNGTDFTSVTYDTGFTGGKYTKVGDLVHIQGALMTDAITVGSASGTIEIAGLPFAIGSSTNGRDGFISGSIGVAVDFAIDHPVSLYGGANNSRIVPMTRNTANGATDNLQVSDLDTGANKNLIYFSATYKS